MHVCQVERVGETWITVGFTCAGCRSTDDKKATMAREEVEDGGSLGDVVVVIIDDGVVVSEDGE